MINLENKKVIITGAAAGIGRATAVKCVEHGADVLVIDINENGLVKLQKELGEDKVKIFNFDISDLGKIKDFFVQLRKDDIKIDCLVNNAGIYLGKSVLDYSDEDIAKVMAINLIAPIYFSKEFARDKMNGKKQGVIVNIASVSGEAGTSESVYGATKGGLLGLTKSNAIDFSPYVRVNAVAPSVTKTALVKNIPEERLKMHEKHNLIKEWIEPEDIGNAVLFLLSDVSGHCTGMTLDVNNGRYLR
ncbi:MAG: SDR family oxidoreductase [Candidatus Moranbacteria bacterium]|nr:SDR family oxidoreductase [Candidatus Moranbacteria bacterium]